MAVAAAIVREARRILDPPAEPKPRRGLAMIIGSCLVFAGVGFAGPSAVALTLGPRTSWLPPWYLPVAYANWNEWVVVPAMWVAIVVGALGLWTCWRALEAGWRPRPWRLFGLGAALSAAVGFVLPLTSADVLMYAAYGRLQTIGQNPYDITPAMIIRQEFDPVLRWTERPWQDTPSVYGPLASAVQRLASMLGGANMHATVFWLQLMTTLPFILIALLAVIVTRGDVVAQARAVLLILLNPLMVLAIVAGAHNEALTMLFAFAGLCLMRKSPLLAGLGIGIAGTIKVSLVFYGLAMAWTYRRSPGKLVQLVVGAAGPLVLAYVVWMPQTVLAASRNTTYVSQGSWLSPAFNTLGPLIGAEATHQFVAITGWVAMIVATWMLSRVVPRTRVPGGDPSWDAMADPLSRAGRAAAVLVCAWLLTSPYTWAWYDLLAWVPLALIACPRLDAIMAWRVTWLSLAYVTGRVYPYGPQMVATMTVIRDNICPVAQWLALIALVIWWWRDGHELPSLARIRFGHAWLFWSRRNLRSSGAADRQR